MEVLEHLTYRVVMVISVKLFCVFPCHDLILIADSDQQTFGQCSLMLVGACFFLVDQHWPRMPHYQLRISQKKAEAVRPVAH